MLTTTIYLIHYISSCKRPITSHHSYHMTIQYPTVLYSCYWTVVIVKLTSHVKSTIKAVDREKHPNEILVNFFWSFGNWIQA